MLTGELGRSIVNEAAAAAGKPVINLGQGFLWVISLALHELGLVALTRRYYLAGTIPPRSSSTLRSRRWTVSSVISTLLLRYSCTYAPPKRAPETDGLLSLSIQGRLRLREALSSAYSPYFGRTLDPATEIVVTSGANEGMLSAFMGFVEPGDEVIVMEPFFDQYISNIEMAGGTIKYVALHPPEKGDTEVCPASDWRLDLKELEAAITSKTRMIVVNTPHNPIGKVFSREELLGIGELCVKNDIIILSDEVSTLVGTA